MTGANCVRTVGAASNLSLPNVVGNFPKSLGQVHVTENFVEYFQGLSTRTPATAGLFGSDPNNLRSFFTNLDVVDSSGNVLLRNAEPGKVGTLGARWIQGPGQFGLDMSLAKRIGSNALTTPA